MPFSPDEQFARPETKPDVFSLDGLIAWLEKQPAKRRYDWHNCQGECLIGRYYAAMGEGILYHHVFKDCPDGAYYTVCKTRPWTYGAALQRARALRKQMED